MNSLVQPILIPIIAGIAVLFIPKRARFAREAISILISALTLFLAVRLFIDRPLSMRLGVTLLLKMDSLSAFVSLFIALFGLLIALYSLKFMKGKEDLNQYYGYLLMTIGGSIGAALANDLIFFITYIFSIYTRRFNTDKFTKI